MNCLCCKWCIFVNILVFWVRCRPGQLILISRIMEASLEIPKGGFSFDLCKRLIRWTTFSLFMTWCGRNAWLESQANYGSSSIIKKAKKTGTTIVGESFGNQFKRSQIVFLSRYHFQGWCSSWSWYSRYLWTHRCRQVLKAMWLSVLDDWTGIANRSTTLPRIFSVAVIHFALEPKTVSLINCTEPEHLRIVKMLLVTVSFTPNGKFEWTFFTTEMMASNLTLHRLTTGCFIITGGNVFWIHAYRRECRVITAVTMLSQYLFRYQVCRICLSLFQIWLETRAI